MLTGHAGVKYGLTVPKRDVKPLVKKNVLGFGEEEDSEDDRSAVAKQIKKQAQQKQTDKKVHCLFYSSSSTLYTTYQGD